jgi:hypothetical protein
MTNLAKSEPFDRNAYERAVVLWDRDPGSLTDSDLDLIATIDPGMAEKAYSARTRATPAAYPWRSKALLPAPATPAPGAAGDPDGAPSRKEIERVVLPILKLISKCLTGHEAFAHELEGRIEAHEAQLLMLAAQPKGLSYGGIWGDGEAHGRDVLVTRGGSLWVSERPTTQQPGSPDSGWRMITKGGIR